MFENLDKNCGSILEHMAGVSYIDFGFSLFLFFTTVPVNALIIIGLYRYSHLLNRNYYLIILNIAIADLLMGLLCDPMSVSFHLKEALNADINPAELSSLHYMFFLTNSVSVLSMAALTVDRLGVILQPFFYYSKVTKKRMIIVLIGTWLISASLTTSYFFIGYIRFLVVFAFTTVIITLIFMVVTMSLLRRRLRDAKINELQRQDSRRSRDQSLVGFRRRTKNNIEFTHMDKKITKTFLYMLLLFVINYIPCIVLAVYMNVCDDCDCKFIHIMRDIVFQTILSSALCRAVNFTLGLSAIKEAIKSLFRRASVDGNEIPLKVSH